MPPKAETLSQTNIRTPMNSWTKYLVAALSLCLLPGSSFAFGLKDVEAQAKQLAAKPFEYPDKIPPALAALSYDQHRDIRFKPENTLWPSTRKHFDVQMLHTGGIYNYGVKIHIYDAEGIREYPYNSDEFDFGKNAAPKDLPRNLGFAGFRIRYPLNRPDVQDEVVVFSGASYFRAVSRDTLYGLSARGLAIDTALPSGEEFPIFREFWLERPAAESDYIRIYALLDSKRITGAYEFIISPGDNTRTRVNATLFPREKIKEPGIAPLTSMFFLGENTPRPTFEWRPEIHDSDGLLLQNGNGEVIWRPLENQKQLRLSMFGLDNPKGFGLIQRDRAFSSYEDLETHQQRRPSSWITPIGDWGKGSVKLTEIPTNNEYNDNIVAYWVPAETLQPGEAHHFEYYLDWNQHGPEIQNVAKVVSTRLATDSKKNARQFIIDFTGDDLLELSNKQSIEANVWTDTHSRHNSHYFTPNPEINGVRLTLNLDKDQDSTERSEIRVQLWHEGKPLSEIWTYLLEK